MKKITCLLLLVLAAGLLPSCKVDKAYDLDQPIDTHVRLIKGLTIPIGDVGKIDTKTMMVILGSDYISYDEEGHVVLDFTENPELVLEFDIKGLNMHHSYSFGGPVGVDLDMEVGNTSPFAFSLEASFIDDAGKLVPAYNPLIKGEVESGHPDDPSFSYITLSATVKEIVPFDGIRFRFHFHGGELVGKKYTVTDQESLTFNGLKAHLPEGLEFDTDWWAALKPYLTFVKLIFKSGK